jgi:hypothetical protein
MQMKQTEQLHYGFTDKRHLHEPPQFEVVTQVK